MPKVTISDELLHVVRQLVADRHAEVRRYLRVRDEHGPPLSPETRANIERHAAQCDEALTALCRAVEPEDATIPRAPRDVTTC